MAEILDEFLSEQRVHLTCSTLDALNYESIVRLWELFIKDVLSLMKNGGMSLVRQSRPWLPHDPRLWYCQAPHHFQRSVRFAMQIPTGRAISRIRGCFRDIRSFASCLNANSGGLCRSNACVPLERRWESGWSECSPFRPTLALVGGPRHRSRSHNKIPEPDPDGCDEGEAEEADRHLLLS